MQANLIYFSTEHNFNLDCCMCLISETEENNSTNYEEIEKQNDIIEIICLKKERSSRRLDAIW
jgi:hypothetical protein